LPRFKLAQFMWVMFLICAFSILGSDNAEAEQELASWYGPGFQGKPMADGETFNPNGYTTASKTLPMGTDLIVGYKGKSIPVTVTDRVPVSGDRDLDLSQRAAQAIGLIKPGVDYVQVSCADGGNYPNCSPPHEGTSTQGNPAVQGDPAFQGDTTLQSAPTNQGDTTFQGNPAIQGESAIQDGTTLQSDPTIQGNTILQSDPAIQGDPTIQGNTTLQDAPTIQGNPAVQGSTTFQGAPTFQGDPAVQGDTTFQGGASGGMHMVQPGETLSGIAAKLGIPVEYLAMHNGIANPDLIYSGQALLY
jgi:rare lipoprotein A (peptidoglycan hydrolase)